MRGYEAVRAQAAFTLPRLPIFASPKTPLLVSAVQPVSGSVSQPAPQPRPKAWVSVLPELCKGCELCVYACPSGNLTLSTGLTAKGYHPAVFSYDGKRGPCTACGICYWVCPDMAVSEIKRLKQ